MAARPTDLQSIAPAPSPVAAGAPGGSALRLFGRRRPVALGAGAGSLRAALTPIGIVTLIILAAPLLATHTALDVTSAGPFRAPALAYPFGTDEIGRDIFSRVLYGMRESWLSALGVITVGAAFGALVGALAGAFGGLIDMVLMRLTDLFLALPAPVIAIAVIASIGPSLFHTLLALSVVWWPWYARMVRAEVRAHASRPHADAARLAGVSRARLVLRHLLPAALAPVVVTMSLDVGNLILALASLSFIGLGAPPPAPELGAMSAQGLEYLLAYWWVPIAPATAAALLALVANLLGDRANRRLNQGRT
ncbi:MAG TPA: ABC transporter permease [Solirubrobacteraceae bacterium]|nr:ABC transporter permease [Solirubrobacteraceae bacterium]